MWATTGSAPAGSRPWPTARSRCTSRSPASPGTRRARHGPRCAPATSGCRTSSCSRRPTRGRTGRRAGSKSGSPIGRHPARRAVAEGARAASSRGRRAAPRRPQEVAGGDRSRVALRAWPPWTSAEQPSSTSSSTRQLNQSCVCSAGPRRRRGLSSMPRPIARVVPPSSGPFSNTSPRPTPTLAGGVEEPALGDGWPTAARPARLDRRRVPRPAAGPAAAARTPVPKCPRWSYSAVQEGLVVRGSAGSARTSSGSPRRRRRRHRSANATRGRSGLAGGGPRGRR